MNVGPIAHLRGDAALVHEHEARLSRFLWAQRLKGWARPESLVSDDVGLGQVEKREDEPTAAHTLFNLADKRHGRASTAVSSKLALSDWRRYLGDATVVMAILDRLAMHAIRVDIDSLSYRQHLAEPRAATHSAPATRSPG